MTNQRLNSWLLIVALVLCGALGIFIFLGFLRFVLGHPQPTSNRGGVSYAQATMREAAISLEKYHNTHGSYPPHAYTGTFYGPVNEKLFQPMILPGNKININGDTTYIDPFRRKKLFANDQWGSTVHDHRKGPDRIKGYQVQYYRNSSGNQALLISNGPSWSGVLASEIIGDIKSNATHKEMMESLSNYLYDPTNGTTSQGNLIRFVSPDLHVNRETTAVASSHSSR